MARETLSLATCNIEGDKHVPTVRDFMSEYQPYIFCLQEAPQSAVANLSSELGYSFVFQPTTELKKAFYPVLKSDLTLGVAILSLGQLTNSGHYTYRGHPDLVPIYTPGQPNSANREYLFARHGKFMFSTTHFTWTKNGQPNAEQIHDLPLFLTQVNSLGEQVLAGDFNAPRPNEIYHGLTQNLTDNVPPDYFSTLDTPLHRHPELNWVVDYIFSTPGYLVSDVQAITGVSDHKVLLANVSTS